MKVLNVERWNTLRALVEKEPYVGWYNFVGLEGPLGWWEHACLHDISQGLHTEPLKSRAWRVANSEPNHGFLTTQEEKAKMVKLLTEAAADPNAKEKAQAKIVLDGSVTGERMRMRTPGPKVAIFRVDDFKGGTVKESTWIYAIRAHLRGKVHLKGKTLEEQGVFIEKALARCPLLLGCLVEEKPDTVVDAPVAQASGS